MINDMNTATEARILQLAAAIRDLIQDGTGREAELLHTQYLDLAAAIDAIHALNHAPELLDALNAWSQQNPLPADRVTVYSACVNYATLEADLMELTIPRKWLEPRNYGLEYGGITGKFFGVSTIRDPRDWMLDPADAIFHALDYHSAEGNQDLTKTIDRITRSETARRAQNQQLAQQFSKMLDNRQHGFTSKANVSQPSECETPEKDPTT